MLIGDQGREATAPEKVGRPGRLADDKEVGGVALIGNRDADSTRQRRHRRRARVLGKEKWI